MNIKYLERVERIDRLIRIKSTGNPYALAKKIGISTSKLYLYIGIMKHLGAPIKYSRLRKSYYYETSGSFNFKFNENNDLNNDHAE